MKRLLAGLAVAVLLSACSSQLAPPAPTATSLQPIIPPSPTAFQPAQPTSPPPTPTPTVARTWPAPFTYGMPTPPATPVPTPVDPFPFDPETVNILLVGTDQRNSAGVRTDTLILLSVNPPARRAALISIPRDLYVYLPGLTMQRVNTAFLLGETQAYPGGGRALLRDTLLYNLGLRVDYMALVDMGGFRSLIDRIGGVDVDVSCPYTDWRLKDPELPPDDANNWELFTVSPGVIHMDGDLALWYARARSKSSDFDRARRQQELLRAIYRRILRLELIPQLPGLYGQLTRLVETDLPLDVLLHLTLLAPWIDSAQVRSGFIGRDQTTSWRVPGSGAQVLLPRPEAIRALFEEALDSEAEESGVPQTFATVEVINASQHPDWGQLAAARLNYAGYRAFVARRRPTGEPTHLVDYGQAEPNHRARLLRLLGLGDDDFRLEPDSASPFVFTLVVGDDYDPCFNPTRDQGAWAKPVWP